MRSKALAAAGIAALALTGCKSKVSDSSTQALKTCGLGEVLVGPSASWKCVPADSLEFASAGRADVATSAAHAGHVGSVGHADTADQVDQVTPAAHTVLGTAPAGLDGGADAGIALEVYGPVRTFGSAPVPRLLTFGVQTSGDPVTATGSAELTMLEVPLRLPSTQTVTITTVGAISGDGTIKAPAVCQIALRLINADTGVTFATVGTDTASGFSSPDGGVNAETPFMATGTVTLDAGTYRIDSNLSHLGGAMTCVDFGLASGTPAQIFVEAL